ncbi:hypothetical protein DSM112329_03560 [Paraconexibacter sp. AEG42_29]|uniref:Uncharacterized protein n=1 Tax=Paraconexibacter sp. AEG42_29 TaxID=2997339 RepID=A0AAU7AYE5_9ACTN
MSQPVKLATRLLADGLGEPAPDGTAEYYIGNR